jgi:uncharacterized delta-60 repeat protein
MKAMWFIGGLLISAHLLRAASFQNLGFDSANTNNLTSGFWGKPQNVLPGWTISPAQQTIGVDAITVGSGFVNLSSSPPAEGRFFLDFFGPPGPGEQWTLSQTGDIPEGARQVHFISSDAHVSLTVNGVDVPLVFLPRTIDAAHEVNDVFGDVSGFAGQKVNMAFTTEITQGRLDAGLDSITFVVPQPATGNPGSVDTTFQAAADDQVNTLALQPDGKVVIGGVFTNVNGIARNQFARLNADGTLDTAFDPPLARPVSGTHAVTATVLQSDGRCLVAGISGQTQPSPSDPFVGEGDYIARFTAAGQLDPSFTTFVQTNREYEISENVALAVRNDGSIIVALALYRGVQGMLCQLYGVTPTGLPDPDLHLPIELIMGAPPSQASFAAQADGKLLLVVENSVVRLNLDGSLDTTFQFPPELVNYQYAVSSIAVQPDGRILITGARTARLQADGELDQSFQSSPGGTKIALQSDGRIFVAGGTITRLNQEGSLDPSFPAVTLTGNASDLIVLPDDRILVAGSFSQVNGVPRSNLAVVFAGSSPPLVLKSDPPFGMRTNFFGFTLNGASDKAVVVEASTGVTSLAWSPLSTNLLTGGSFHFSDPQWTNFSSRFYRVRVQ